VSNLGQTRFQSMVEAWANVLIGWLVAVTSQVLIFPLFGIQVPLSTNIKISIFFTAISIIRSYSLRRFYNWHHRRGDRKELLNGLPPTVSR
jgi:hypothetical protein